MPQVPIYVKIILKIYMKTFHLNTLELSLGISTYIMHIHIFIWAPFFSWSYLYVLIYIILPYIQEF